MSDFSVRLRQWVNDLWQEGAAPEWRALTGDAGFRRYFRLASNPATLAVYAPPETEDMDAFINIAEYLAKHGVAVPKIIAYEKEQGFMLIEDLGRDLLSCKLSADTVSDLYEVSLASLLKIQQSTPSQNGDSPFPVFSQQKLRQEMDLFKDWFVPKLLGYTLLAEEKTLLEQWFSLLEISALEQPQVVVHRDYHSRNLIYREGGLPGVIDFQDAVIGPITYDLVSLLKDCYVAWPPEQVRNWAISYAKAAETMGLMPSVDEPLFLRWFDWMGQQRHIKVLGIFARLSLRDGKHGYLNDLPLVVQYVADTAKNYPEAKAFLTFFEEKLMPIIIQQPWYKKPL